ncbi:hypothetical protein AOQ84DRAFT_440929 [Glonium stellatum]|uniref:Apple domain-containing protein n=1 Tax=Glonium stellatum TaxID=574774 RepID=A0A8E2JRC0_9PEZI|nr:hypothetical protein AOQ84DRAFT_440929 [Glonium stellatum]
MRIDRSWLQSLCSWTLISIAALSTGAAIEIFEIGSLDAAEPQTRDLEVRASSQCPSSYQSDNGMNFTIYCNENIPFSDVFQPFAVSTMEECMERCSRYWGASQGCYGVVWNQNTTDCWIKNSTISTIGIYPETGTHAALVPRSQLSPLDTSCPFDDLSVQTLSSGEGFTIHCGKVIGGFDDCFQEYPECLSSPFIGYWHADSLQECMRICAQSHPLCLAVSWNPGMEIGYANCWPKTGSGNAIADPATGQGVLHTAVVTSIETINTTCPSDNSYTTSGKTFDIHCGQLNTGTNITAVHRANLTSCLDTCANNKQGCVSVVFDSTLQGGFQNCYLQNTTSVIRDNANTTFALLTGTSIPTSTPSGTNSPASSGGSSSSKAWIAGPVIGGIVAIALIIGAFLWWRKRTAQHKQQEYSLAPANHYSPTELDSSQAAEMGTTEMGQVYGNQTGVKYKHQSQTAQPPQELPT